MEQRRRTATSEDELLMMAEVAHLYYIGDFTQERIASRVGISRSKVSRMLKEARAQGIVEISIHSPLSTVPDLQEELVRRLDLRECLVLAVLHHESGIFEATDTASKVAALAARYMQENIAEGDVVGLGWGRSTYRVVHSRFLKGKGSVTVAQMMGSIGGSIPDLDGVAMTARLADALGASAHYLHVPMLVTEAAVRNGLLRDPHIRRTLEVARRADIMLAGVGVINRDFGQYRTGYLSDADLEYIQEHGVVGEVCGVYFSRQGELRRLEMNERMIAMEAENIKRIPSRVGVSWGSQKVVANLGAARSGLLNVLITDEDTARQMLDILSGERSAVSATSDEA
jgi:deoxyribonucleoside regulator